jgi:hypothetical protein
MAALGHKGRERQKSDNRNRETALHPQILHRDKRQSSAPVIRCTKARPFSVKVWRIWKKLARASKAIQP